MDDTPYEERRGGSYVRQADGTRRLVERTEEPDPTVVKIKRETVFQERPSTARDPIEPMDPPADAPSADPPSTIDDAPPAETRKPEKRGK